MPAYFKQLIPLLLILLSACSEGQKESFNSIQSIFNAFPSYSGKSEYTTSPYVTAGDRLYMVGFQDGSFPDYGWHVEGEMAGIWDHPIKLMDGFSIAIAEGESTPECLPKASSFTNFPIGNQLTYELSSLGLTVTQTQVVPDGEEGLVVDITIENNGSEDKNLNVGFTGRVDLTPVWLWEEADIADGRDQARWVDNKVVARDADNPWFTVFGADLEGATYQEDAWCPQERKGLGVDASLMNKVSVDANGTASIRYIIAGSYLSEDDALSTYEELQRNAMSLVKEKAARFENIRTTAEINIPDPKLMEMYDWVRWNTDWLIRDVPEVGRGLSAGIADFPWWFGADNCYALQGLLSTGRHDEVLATIDLLIELSESVNDNGRIMHEASTNGVVFNKGNLNETPHFIWLLWEVYRWTGDRAMLERYYPTVKKGLNWLSEDQDQDQNGYPDGPGMMEIHGLHSEMIDVVVYTQQAFEAAAKMAKELEDDEMVDAYQQKASELKDKINNEWWVAGDNSYADFRSTKEEAVELIEAAIVRSDTIDKPWAIEELEQRLAQLSSQAISGTAPFVVHHNWVVNTPLEMNIADPEKAALALETARKYTNRFGTYVTGIDRDEGNDQSSGWKSFSYVGAVMTLPTGVQAIAEANYGNTEEAVKYLHMLYNSFNYTLPGSMYEVSPDYGQMVQAWNIYGVAVPIVNHFFGIKPIAHEKKVVIAPALPEKWGEASISNVVIGNTTLDFSYDQNSDTHNYRIEIADATWTPLLIVPEGQQKLRINGKNYDMSKRNSRSILIE